MPGFTKCFVCFVSQLIDRDIVTIITQMVAVQGQRILANKSNFGWFLSPAGRKSCVRKLLTIWEGDGDLVNRGWEAELGVVFTPSPSPIAPHPPWCFPGRSSPHGTA